MLSYCTCCMSWIEFFWRLSIICSIVEHPAYPINFSKTQSISKVITSSCARSRAFSISCCHWFAMVIPYVSTISTNGFSKYGTICPALCPVAPCAILYDSRRVTFLSVFFSI